MAGGIILMHWRLDSLDEPAWRRLLATAERPALQQSWGYGVAVAGQGHAVARAVLDDGGRCLALAQVVRRRLPFGWGSWGGWGLGLLLRGPVWLEAPDAESEAMAIDGLRAALGRTLLVWQPDDDHASERRAGWRRVWTGPSTAWLDLTLPAALLRSRLDRKWRNRLVQAESTSTSAIEAVGGSHFEWLVEANERQRLRVGYRGPSAGFIRALAATGRRGMMALIARHEGAPVAGVLLARHGRAATYYVGVTTAAGRELRAHHRLLWEGVLRLQRAGCTALDLGGIDTVSNPGIARFKLALGGAPLTLAGSYLVPPRRR
jgi:hypothetical protein